MLFTELRTTILGIQNENYRWPPSVPVHRKHISYQARPTTFFEAEPWNMNNLPRFMTPGMNMLELAQ